MPAPRRFVLAVIFALLAVLPSFALAQDATPTAGADPNAKVGTRPAVTAGRLDLAAMTLPSDDMPSGVALTFEAYVPIEALAAQLASGGITASDIAKIGLTSFYQSVSATGDNAMSVRSYVEEFGGADGATAGFKLLEDEARFSPGDVGAPTYTDKPGLGVGEEPSEVTVSTGTGSDGKTPTNGLDATFRVGRLLVGVSIDTTGATPPDETNLADLARKLDDRVNAVLNGDDVAGVDPRLPARLLSFAPDPAAIVGVQDGYVSAADSFGPTVPQAAIDAYSSGYVKSYGLGFKTDPTAPLPIVRLSLSSFSSESGPLAILNDAAKSTPAYAGLESARLEPIAGTSAATAFSYENPLKSGKPDSFRIIAAVADRLFTVDVQGAASVEDARSIAESLTTQQVACLAATGDCAPATVAAGPVATPVSGA